MVYLLIAVIILYLIDYIKNLPRKNYTLVIRNVCLFPGPRYQSEGKYSGEMFRTVLLSPKINNAINEHCKVIVDLDGTNGYGVGFLQEAFGGLLSEFTIEELEKTLEFISNEEPELIDEIYGYMEAANHNIEMNYNSSIAPNNE